MCKTKEQSKSELGTTGQWCPCCIPLVWNFTFTTTSGRKYNMKATVKLKANQLLSNRSWGSPSERVWTGRRGSPSEEVWTGLRGAELGVGFPSCKVWSLGFPCDLSHGNHTMWTDWQTDTYENFTFPQTTYAGCKNRMWPSWRDGINTGVCNWRDPLPRVIFSAKYQILHPYIMCDIFDTLHWCTFHVSNGHSSHTLPPSNDCITQSNG